MHKILSVENLSKVFYTKEGEIKAIDKISFDVNKNDFICIVGSSGCGKSTLLNIIAGLDKPSNGNITFYKNKH